MIDKWFKKDIEKILRDKHIVVFIDESKKADFLLKSLDDTFIQYSANGEVEELRVKYHVEKESTQNKYIIYTTTPKDKLKFIREYCETNGSIEIKSIQNYIKQKIFENLKENLNLGENELLSAAKNSIGQDELYWRGLISGTSGIFNLDKELLPFIDNPEAYVSKYDDQTREEFFKKIAQYLKQQYIEKPSSTVAKEVVHHIFDVLLLNETEDRLAMDTYKRWLDSKEHESSFSSYLKAYKIGADIDIWGVNANHPFGEIDFLWLKEIGENLNDIAKLTNLSAKINQRASSKEAIKLGIKFWKDVKVLIDFDQKQMSNLSSLGDCIDFYTQKLYKVDQAIRGLYTEFIDDEAILGNFQEYYKNLMSIFIDKWFYYFGDYKETQSGKLKGIIQENQDEKIAVIVGDGVTYEISQNIASLISKEFKCENNYILVDTPSITENNMSRIYVSSGETLKTLAEREKFLANEFPSKNIGFVYLDHVNENTQFDCLISQYKDIDELGDKMNNKALKYFAESENTFAKKIELLLNNGYKKVFLITDHGFVLTGHIKEHDKIDATFDGTAKKAERYIRTVKKQLVDSFYIEKEQQHNEFNYVYFAKSMNPFKTTGNYGFAHGGLAPQELITPYLVWSNDRKDFNAIQVSITNKKELKNVTGNLFQLKIEANGKANDIFSIERKIVILQFASGKQISKSDIVTLKSGESMKKDFDFDGHSLIEIQILDADTKEILDKTEVTKKNDRDLGGLL